MGAVGDGDARDGGDVAGGRGGSQGGRAEGHHEGAHSTQHGLGFLRQGYFVLYMGMYDGINDKMTKIDMPRVTPLRRQRVSGSGQPSGFRAGCFTR